MTKTILAGVYVFLLMLNASQSLAAWKGPRTLVSGSWGNGPGQFSWDGGDDVDSFPHVFKVDKNGFVVIPDVANKRITIYDAKGRIEHIVSKPAELPDLDSSWGWPLNGFQVFPGGNSMTVDCDYQSRGGGRSPTKICFLDYTGSIMSKIDIAGVNDETVATNNGFIIAKKPLYYLFSPTGHLLQEYSREPLEEGILGEMERRPDGAYGLTVRYPERTSSIVVPESPPENVSRDSQGHLYVTQRFMHSQGRKTTQHYRIIRYGYCGKQAARLDLPGDIKEEDGSDSTVGIRWKTVADYGSPTVAPNGDVYTWRRTPDKYSILKWTWVDDPNIPSGPDAPTGLKVSPSTTGISLTWTAAPQDPGCVTGYEIARSATPAGAHSTIATVKSGVLKYDDTSVGAGGTYYYKVRAVSGSEKSAYTSETSGKR